MLRRNEVNCTWNMSDEMARRQDQDYIASLNMINEGGVAFEKTEEENQMDQSNLNDSKY